MKASFVRRSTTLVVLAAALCAGATLPGSAFAAGYRLIGWNNLGMHCMDADYAVLSLLPPFNTIQAQLIDPTGQLVTSASGIRVTYEAVADPAGSINTSSIGKTNFWEHEDQLFGVSLSPDAGLFGAQMPGPANVPQPMDFDLATSEFVATGIPITPRDDAGNHNTYPMMRLVARDAAGTLLAKTDIVLPVSDEMSCKSCHASGTSAEAMPASGWVDDFADPERDFRMNILRLHDDTDGALQSFQDALAQVGYNPAGLEATVVQDGRSVLCASCHLSEALPGSGLPGISALTAAIHTAMAGTTDPATGLRLDDVSNRSACYTCHPGSKTRCLRGAMGSAVAADGSMEMQCQSCHGHMKDVGAPTRTGWLEEPRCDSCHTGTAMQNNGQIRYTSVFNVDGSVRQAVSDTFATNDNTPAAGLSLYRFSKGHGGLECSACHGSTHAEFPSSHASDNIQSVAAQGHKGVLAECGSCHASTPSTVTGGPHGLHPIGASWVSAHGNVAETIGTSGCRDCHGSDYRGTVLSRSQADRTVTSTYGSRTFWRGFQIGCYACHAGPRSESGTTNHPAQVQNATASTTTGKPVVLPLVATDADGNALTLRVVSQPVHGTTGIAGAQATYYPDDTFQGTDQFTFAAWDGSIDSNLGTATLTVAPPVNQPPSVTSASATPNPVGGSTTSLAATATDDGGEPALTYSWSVVSAPASGNVTFSPNGTNAAKVATATFNRAGAWLLRATATDTAGATGTRDVAVTVNATVTTIAVSPGSVTLDQNATQQFSAIVKDQFGITIAAPAVTWSITGSNTITQAGLATAGTTAGAYTVTASSGAKSATATLTVLPPPNQPPSVSSASATPNPVTGSTAALAATATDDGGEPALAYTWSIVSAPAGGSATFSPNGTNAAKASTATFNRAGAWTLRVTAKDGAGATGTRDLVVTVNATLTKIAVTPASATVNQKGKQQFVAPATDQFGIVLSPQPSFAWSITGPNSITPAGLATAGTTSGTYTVTAGSSGKSGTATLTVTKGKH